MTEPKCRPQRDLAGWAAWAMLFITLLAAAFTIYGQFKVLNYRMDSSDTDRAVMQKKLDEMANSLARIEGTLQVRKAEQ